QCQLERQLRSDFEAELGVREDARDVQSFVTGALRAARAPESRRPSRAPAANAWRRRFVFLLAATMVLATGLAAAEVDFAGRAWHAATEKVAFLFGPSTAPRAGATIAPRQPTETAKSGPTSEPAVEDWTRETTNVAPPVAATVEPPAETQGRVALATAARRVPAAKPAVET